MLIKLAIIGAILVITGLVFSSEINTLFPNTSATMMESIKNDVGNISSKTTQSVENRIDDSLDNIVEKTNNKINDEINNAKDSSKELVANKISNINPIQTITNIFKSDDMSKNSENIQTDDTSMNKQSTQNLIHETLSLSTTHQPDDSILLNYSDSTRKTESVTVIIRTSDKEIFSGTFHTSNFETIVSDTSDTPYYVDMIVEHQDYGTVTSSVFNSGEYSDSIINGIFSQLN